MATIKSKYTHIKTLGNTRYVFQISDDIFEKTKLSDFAKNSTGTCRSGDICISSTGKKGTFLGKDPTDSFIFLVGDAVEAYVVGNEWVPTGEKTEIKWDFVYQFDHALQYGSDLIYVDIRPEAFQHSNRNDFQELKSGQTFCFIKDDLAELRFIVGMKNKNTLVVANQKSKNDVYYWTTFNNGFLFKNEDSLFPIDWVKEESLNNNVTADIKGDWRLIRDQKYNISVDAFSALQDPTMSAFHSGQRLLLVKDNVIATVLGVTVDGALGVLIEGLAQHFVPGSLGLGLFEKINGDVVIVWDTNPPAKETKRKAEDVLEAPVAKK